MSKPTPEQLSNMITEGIEPGQLGLVEDQVEPGDMRTVLRMATQLSRYAAELQQHAHKGNIRGARAIIAEMGGALEEASAHINRLSDEVGMVKLSPNHNT